MAIHDVTPPTYAVFRLPKVLQATALSRSTVYAMIADGRFPKPVKLGERAVGWPEAEITAWLESRKSARDAA